MNAQRLPKQKGTFSAGKTFPGDRLNGSFIRGNGLKCFLQSLASYPITSDLYFISIVDSFFDPC
jgi:hypothetical protein